VTHLDGAVVGSLTDGDIRRALLRGCSLDTSVAESMSKEFLAAQTDESRSKFERLMDVHELDAVPVLDDASHLADIWFRDASDYAALKQLPQVNVIRMAGGRGQRLMPLTASRPKPLVPLNGVPPIESLLRRLSRQGFRQVLIAIGYLSAKVREYLGDGSEFGLQISYLEESVPLGTAGALAMVRNSHQVPTLVINADVVTDMRFDRFVASCCSPNAITTAGVFRYQTALPFGVAHQENGILMDVIEKPILHHDILAGINLITEETRLLVQEGEKVDMTELLLRARDSGQTVQVREIEGFWADMGTTQAFAELLSSPYPG